MVRTAAAMYREKNRAKLVGKQRVYYSIHRMEYIAYMQKYFQENKKSHLNYTIGNCEYLEASVHARTHLNK